MDQILPPPLVGLGGTRYARKNSKWPTRGPVLAPKALCSKCPGAQQMCSLCKLAAFTKLSGPMETSPLPLAIPARTSPFIPGTGKSVPFIPEIERTYYL